MIFFHSAAFITSNHQAVCVLSSLPIAFLALWRTLGAPVRQHVLKEWPDSSQPPPHTSHDPCFGTSQVPLVWNQSYHKLMHGSFAETCQDEHLCLPDAGLHACRSLYVLKSSGQTPRMTWSPRHALALKGGGCCFHKGEQQPRPGQHALPDRTQSSSWRKWLECLLWSHPTKTVRYSWSVLLFRTARCKRSKAGKRRDVVTLPCNCSIPSISQEPPVLAS